MSPLVFSTVNVVPRLVEHSAAPAAKACSGVASTIAINTKESPIGAPIPVSATDIDKNILAFSALKFVDNPPSNTSKMSPRYPS